MLAFLLAAAAAAAPAQGQRPPDFAVSPEKREALIQAIEAELRDKYVFPERLDEAFGRLRPKWSSADFRKLDHALPLLERMNADLQDVFHDRHLNLSLASTKPPGMFGDPEKADPKQLEQLQAFERLVHYGVVRAEILPGNVGVLELRNFSSKSPGQSKAYAAAMTFLGETDALIVDLRQNGGGDGEAVADLVGYLLDQRTLLQREELRGVGAREQWSAATVEGPRYGMTRDVFVLTSKRSFSAAEEFAYDLQTQKRATIVGEASGGGANHNRFARVAQDFALSIPYGTVKNAVTGKNWEGTGVQPDLAVKAEDALKVAHRTAVERRLPRETDPRRKERLVRLVADLQ